MIYCQTGKNKSSLFIFTKIMKRSSFSFALCLWTFRTFLIIFHSNFHNFHDFGGKITSVKTMLIISLPLKVLAINVSVELVDPRKYEGARNFPSEQWVGVNFLVYPVRAMINSGLKGHKSLYTQKWHTVTWNASWIVPRMKDNQLVRLQAKHSDLYNYGALSPLPLCLKNQC